MVSLYVFQKSDILFFDAVGVDNGQLPVDGGIERDDGLASRQSQWLELVVDDVEQVVVVECIDLDEHIETASGVVAFHHLRDFLQFLKYEIKLAWVFEKESDISTRLISDFLWVDNKLRPFEYSKIS